MAASPKYSPLAFIILVFVLSIPFWVLGVLSSRQLLPALPIAALGFVCPLIAALILRYREAGLAGVIALLKRSYDFTRVRSFAWILPLIFIEPAVKALTFFALRLAGEPIPNLQFSWLTALLLLLIFLIAGLGEELGWSGYVTDPLQDRFGALRASLLIGGVWAIWHFIPLIQAQRSAEFIAWWSLGTIASRVIIVWLYNNTGRSVFVAAFYHALMNLTWQLFPIDGSYFDPRINGLILALIAVVVIAVWRPWLLATRKTTIFDQQG